MRGYMEHDRAAWQEEDSAVYTKLADVAVPARAEQLATLLTLIPFGQTESFRVVEIGCGEGRLARALLECFPHASLLALDGSSSMRQTASERLTAYGSRVSVEPFDLLETGWFATLDDADLIVSSLAIHHLDGAGKRVFFEAAHGRMSDRGALLIADLVQPQRPTVNRLFAGTWDQTTRLQSSELVGSEALYTLFREEQWNIYWYPDPDVDRPSPLFDQLCWLRDAGFEAVDCFWMQAGHAIYGGYKGVESNDTSTLPFDEALRAANAALGRS